jgi:NADH-quinone oxidoreductase subunit C
LDAVPGAKAEILPNDSPCAQRSLLLDAAHAVAAVRFLRDDPALRLDYASNVTGVDWPEAVLKEKVKVRKTVDGVEKEIEETVERKRPGCLEAV